MIEPCASVSNTNYHQLGIFKAVHDSAHDFSSKHVFERGKYRWSLAKSIGWLTFKKETAHCAHDLPENVYKLAMLFIASTYYQPVIHTAAFSRWRLL